MTSAFASYPRQLSVPFGRHHEEDHILLDNDRLNLVIAYVGGDSGAAIRAAFRMAMELQNAAYRHTFGQGLIFAAENAIAIGGISERTGGFPQRL